MPLGGSNILWDEASPPGSESVGLGDDRIRSLKTSARNALDSEHNWPAAGGAATGYHRLGSARAHVGVQSAVSSGDTDGRLMFASDTSRLFGVGSTGTSFIGGQRVLSVGSFVPMTMPQRIHIVCEMGQIKSDANGEFNVTFPNSGFSGVPFVFANATSLMTVGTNLVRPLTTTASIFTGQLVNTYAGAVVSNTTIDWIAFGYRTL